MSVPTALTGQDEARRALSAEALVRIAGEIEQNLRDHPNRPMKRMLLTDEVWTAVVAALRAPSQDRQNLAVDTVNEAT